VKLDTQLTAEDLKQVIAEYKKVVRKEAGKDFPQNPKCSSTCLSRLFSVPGTTLAPRPTVASTKISDDLGTAVNVQTMVFGNLGDTSGTGVGFTRNQPRESRSFTASS